MKRAWVSLFIISFSYSLLIISCSDDAVQPEPPTRLVILYYPEYDQVIPDTPVTFRWGTTSSAADSFKLEITQDSTFATGVSRFGVTSSQHIFNPPPPGDTNYFYWKVTGYWRSVPDSDVSIIQKFKQR